jgi:ketol-acid reductoisomerase
MPVPHRKRRTGVPVGLESKFAKEWIAEAKSGGKNFKAMKEKDKNHPVEVTGAKLRKLMSWINAKEVD